MKLIVLVIGLAIIAFVAWWFFGKHDVAEEQAKVAGSKQVVDVQVNGGYSPEIVVLKKRHPRRP